MVKTYEMSKNYSDLDVWKKGRELVNEVYVLSKLFPKEELFGLTNQIRRSAVSIPSNIAEGCGRYHRKESLHFYYIARGSLYELETQLYLALDQKYISQAQLENAMLLVGSTKKLLNGLIGYFKSTAD